MSSNMYSKVALCLALLACIDGHVLRQHEVPLSPDGMVVEITVKDKRDMHPVSSLKIDFKEKDKKVVMSMEEIPFKVPQVVGESSTEFLPRIEDRHGIRVGSCPTGYTPRGGFCFPDDD